jgi:hypothetical protein
MCHVVSLESIFTHVKKRFCEYEVELGLGNFPPALTQIPLAPLSSYDVFAFVRKLCEKIKTFFSRIQIILVFHLHIFPFFFVPPTHASLDGFEIFQPSVKNIFFCSGNALNDAKRMGLVSPQHFYSDSFSYLRFNCNTNQFHIQFKVVQLFLLSAFFAAPREVSG